MYKTAVYTPVNGVITHQKQQISKRWCCSAVHWHLGNVMLRYTKLWQFLNWASQVAFSQRSHKTWRNICWKCCKLYQIMNRMVTPPCYRCANFHFQNLWDAIRPTFRTTRLKVNTDSPDLQLIGELINRKTANINAKKLQFIHMLTATDLRTSKTAKIKSYFTILLHIYARRCAVI